MADDLHYTEQKSRIYNALNKHFHIKKYDDAEYFLYTYLNNGIFKLSFENNIYIKYDDLWFNCGRIQDQTLKIILTPYVQDYLIKN